MTTESLLLPSPSRLRRLAARTARAVVTVSTTLALVVGLAAVTPRADALPPDDGVAQLLGVLGVGGDPSRNLATWTEGLGNVEELGEQLPLVAASPGGLLGFADLFSKAVSDELATATTFADLSVDKEITIDGGRTGHLLTGVSDEGGGKKLSIVVTVDRQVTGQDLHLSSESPEVELTVSDGITVDLKSRLALEVVWTGPTDNKVYLVSGASTPRLDVDAHAGIDPAAATASLGILGVSLTGSSLDVDAHFFATVNDPDNDGRLYFTENTAGDGELSQDGSLDGLVTVGLDPQGSQPLDDSDPGSRGSVHATFQLGAAAAAAGLPLPTDIDATVTVDWADIGTGAPTVDAPGLADTVGKFQNMSLDDLASGLAQVVVGITAIQKAKFDPDGGGPLPETGDLDLPFMRGKLSDAIQAAAKLKEFLADNTVPAPGQPGFVEGVTDPAQAGKPTFTSLQDLLQKLSTEAGIDLSNLDWDTATSKLALTLGMTQEAPGSGVELDEVSAAASGSDASYGADTLTVDDAGWQTGQWVGRRVVAGTSAGTVASNTDETITLTGDWIGGQPTDDTPYVIAGAEPHVGAVTFANRIENAGGQGIVNANADQTLATVKPSFTTSVTLVLDLQDPKTLDECVGFEGNTEPCPFTKTDGPFETQVESLPLNTDRVMLRTGSTLFGADFPIESAVDLTANAGFFKVRLQGTLEVCHSSLGATCPDGDPSTPMVSVALEELGDAQHDIRMSALFQALTDDPASLLDVDVNVRAHADVEVSLPDAEDFLPSGATAGFTATWADLTDPGTISVDTSDLSEIFKLDFDADDPDALFRLLVKSLQTLAVQLASADTTEGSGVFNKEIPGLGRSLRDLFTSDEANAGAGVTYGAATLTDDTRSGDSLFPTDLVGRTVVVGTQIGVVEAVSGDRKTLTMTKDWETEPADGTPYAMRSALSDAVDRLLALPPDNIQDAVELLNETLGTDVVRFRYLETGGTGNLVMDLDWARSYRTSSPIQLSLGDGGVDGTFAAAQATGMAQVSVDGNVDLGLVVPLVTGDGPATGVDLKVLEDSSLGIRARSELNGVVKGVVGPLSIALGNPAGSQKAVARADLSLDLAKPGAAEDTPVSFSTFIGDVDVTFNETSGTVDCGESLTTPLMACANLPLFLNNTGADDGWTSIDDILVRIPKSSTPADLFDLDDTLPSDGNKPELDLPDDLAQKLADAILDFGNLGDGLEAHLARIEQAFRLASFEGKLPLVGEDLQQGADFIGDLRTTLRESVWNDIPGAGRPANSAEFKTFIDDHLADALEAGGIDAAATVEFSCTETLHQVAPAPTVVATKNPVPTTDPPTDTPPSGTWEYKIVAFQGSGDDTTGDTIASAAGSDDNWTDLDFDSSNEITWTEVEYASGYKVLRKRPGETGFKQIATTTGTSYTDSSVGGPHPAYDDGAITEEPELDPCPLEFIDEVFLNLDVSRGMVSSTHGCQDTGAPKPCIGGSIPLDIGIPGLALRQGVEGDADGISYKLGFAMHFRLGLSKEDGFFVSTHDGWGGDDKARPELQVGFNFDLPDTMKAELAFITVNADKAQGAGHDPTLPLFAGAFQIDVQSAADEASCFGAIGEPACAPDDDARLTMAELGSTPLSDMFEVSLTGKVHIDWILEAEVDSALPGVRANFQMDWSFDSVAPDEFGAPTIAFEDVGISAGSFFEGLLGEVVKELKRVTGPIQPVIDTLYAPIPVLSDLSRLAGGGDVTLITLATTFSTLAGGPKLDFVDTVKSIIEFINRLPTCDDSTPAGKQACFVPLGMFEIDGAKALTTSSSPSAADTMYKSVDALDGDAVKAALNTKDADTSDGKAVFGSGASKGDVEKSGFSFPILDEPTQAFNLLMGGDVDLVTFDSGPLTLGFSWRQDFGPVYAPPPVFVTMAGSASVTLHIKAGLDTYGLRKTVEAIQNGDRTDAITALDGLYFATVDDNGSPLPVVTLTGEIAAGAAVSAVIIKVGIEGGLRLTISFLWNDPNDDGRFRVSEFLQAALTNPACLFTMDGRLSLFLRVYITIGIGIFSTTFSFTLADVTLLDFTVAPDCTPPPPKLGGTTGDTLVVYAGKLGGEAFRGHAAWSNTGADYDEDTVKVISLHYAQKPGDPTGVDPAFDGFAVEMLGERREYLDPNLKRVVVDGTGYGKPMTVTFIGDGKKTTDDQAGSEPTVFEKEAVVIGGDSDDTVTTGTGPSYVDGRGGEDVIVTHDTGVGSSRAWVAGGPHDDTITTGDGDGKVAGDAGLGSETVALDVTHNSVDGGGTKGVTVFDWTKAKDPTGEPGGSDQGADTIGVGLGSNTARGNGGDDKIGVAADAPDGSKQAASNILVGDGGSDRITGGSAGDKIFTAAQVEFGNDDPGPADAEATQAEPNVVDTGLGSDRVWGSQGVDLVTSHSTPTQTAILRGGSADDVLIGGYGTDEAYGGPGHDYLVAEPAEVGEQGANDIVNGRSYGPVRPVTKLPLPNDVSPNTKILVGGLGNDHIIGGDGASTIFGDTRIDAEECAPGNPVVSDPVAESTSAPSDGNDLILGGGGVDTVSAGGGDDIARTFGDADLACGQQGADTLHGGDDADHVWGGTGSDLLYGENGDDHVFGNAGGDTSYGGAGVDVLEGNNGADWISGGADDDVVYGGTRAAGRDDTDTAGPGGTAKGDDLYGDTGSDVLIGDNGTATSPYPFDLAGTSPNAGAGDRVHGGAQDDHAYGGLGDDVVNGNGDDDNLEGNNGADTVHGNDGQDRIIGGSSQEAGPGVGRPDTGDFLHGDGDADLIAGDNAALTVVTDPAEATRVTRGRGFAASYLVELLDLGLTPTAGTSGGDVIEGGADDDVAYGQGGTDRMKGNGEDDHLEGGPGVDWVEGNLGSDDLVGGSSTPLAGTGDATSGQPDAADSLNGGPGDDVVLGDNGQLLRLLPGDSPTRVTVRLGSTAGEAMPERIVERYDLRVGGSLLTAPDADRFGGDRISGGEGVDVLFGQDGRDFVSGGADGDYVEGSGGADVVRGDLALDDASDHTTTVPLADPGWPGSASGPDQLTGATTPHGQDDLIGGSSIRGFRDTADAIEGNGAGDVVLGDNGTLLRTLQGDPGSHTEQVYTDRYPDDAVPDDATRSRTADQEAGDESTRFCTEEQETTCEVAGAFGDDSLFGNAGDDGMWGQDGDDQMYGGTDDDDMFGELGDDTMFGESGEDAMLGDRGGVVNERLDDGDSPEELTVTLSQVPQETFTGFRRGAYDRRVDLLHDVDGDEWIGASTDPAMPHDGITIGGRDRLLGGPDADNIHAGFGDDLANGDSGGDKVFGDDGEDVLWGGRGCDPTLDATNAECLDSEGGFDPTSRGSEDQYVDHLFGGVGESDPAKQDLIGSDVLDFNPRGTYPGDCAAGDWPETTGSGKDAVTVDPCEWFEMTGKDDAVEENNQHHHGTDWIYGGWDRDVMQGNLAANGPNPGDRLIDWTGAYNLYTHCNAAYGGYNDIRLLAPALLDFLNTLAWVDGAGRSADDVLTPGTSAYRELALTYNPDFKDHGNGKAYPNTPGHFEDPIACES
jgi:Ca2+-binding RTX toxin-like protein